MNQASDSASQSQFMSDEELATAWEKPLIIAVCDRCDWNYLLPTSSLPQTCPHCFQGSLAAVKEDLQEMPHLKPPELLLPFVLSASDLLNAIQGFTSNIPFAPQDLKPSVLHNRLQRLFLPMWLVDADVQAIWQAETGFDYQVISHQDYYSENRGGWASREVTEGRIRWEPRLGKLKRNYQNIAAPALDEHNLLRKALGNYNLDQATTYHSQSLENTFVRLPNRSSEDAWPEAQPAMQAAAAEECRRATSADHIRQFTWKPEFQNLNWTLLLLPLYTTYYLDDEDKPQPIMFNGQTGRIHGARRASMKRATHAAMIVLGVAVFIFVLSLLFAAASLLAPPILALAVLGLVVALLIGAGAVLPIATVWWFNRAQQNQGK
jgi:hypothetical protein